jgi:hypothetical protein
MLLMVIVPFVPVLDGRMNWTECFSPNKKAPKLAGMLTFNVEQPVIQCASCREKRPTIHVYPSKSASYPR